MKSIRWVEALKRYDSLKAFLPSSKPMPLIARLKAALERGK